MKRILYICLLFILSLSSHAFQLPPNFESTYLVKKYDQTVAKTELNFNQTDSKIVYHSYSKTQGLAAFFSSDKINETSNLLWRNDSKLPHLHKYQYQRKNKERKNQKFTFDWLDNDTATVKGNYGDTRFQLDINEHVWDRLFVQLALASELQSTNTIKKEYTYNILDKGRLIQYRFEYITDENIRVENNNYETIKFKRIHASGRRTTYFWLSKNLHYLPVKVEQHKKNKLDLSMILTKINFLETKQ